MSSYPDNLTMDPDNPSEELSNEAVLHRPLDHWLAMFLRIITQGSVRTPTMLGELKTLTPAYALSLDSMVWVPTHVSVVESLPSLPSTLFEPPVSLQMCLHPRLILHLDNTAST